MLLMLLPIVHHTVPLFFIKQIKKLLNQVWAIKVHTNGWSCNANWAQVVGWRKVSKWSATDCHCVQCAPQLNASVFVWTASDRALTASIRSQQHRAICSQRLQRLKCASLLTALSKTSSTFSGSLFLVASLRSKQKVVMMITNPPHKHLRQHHHQQPVF